MARSRNRKVQFNHQIDEKVAQQLRAMATKHQTPVGDLIEWMAAQAMKQDGLKLPECYRKAIRLRAIKMRTDEEAELDAAMKALAPHIDRIFEHELKFLAAS